MRTAKACAYTGCLEYSHTESAYCPTHRTQVERPRNQRRSNKRRNAPGNNAATRARRIIRNDWDNGIATICQHCGTPHPPATIELDHIVPLIDGGLDVDTNLQALCKPCHRNKTQAEAAHRRRNTTPPTTNHNNV